MKRKPQVKALAAVFGSAVAVVTIGAIGVSAWAQSASADGDADGRASCSVAMLHGAYGFTATGTLNGVGPVARLGREVFDGRGHASGTATTVVNGVVYPSTFTATYAINPDCSGSAVENDTFVGTAHDSIVIVDGGRGIEAISVDGGATITAAWQKQFPRD